MAKGGEYGWLAIGAFVATWDVLAPETLTAAFKRAPLPVRVGALAITASHLTGLLPRSVDPFYLLQDMLPTTNDTDSSFSELSQPLSSPTQEY